MGVENSPLLKARPETRFWATVIFKFLSLPGSKQICSVEKTKHSLSTHICFCIFVWSFWGHWSRSIYIMSHCCGGGYINGRRARGEDSYHRPRQRHDPFHFGNVFPRRRILGAIPLVVAETLFCLARPCCPLTHPANVPLYRWVHFANIFLYEIFFQRNFDPTKYFPPL